jgi:hypothetical protein
MIKININNAKNNNGKIKVRTMQEEFDILPKGYNFELKNKNNKKEEEKTDGKKQESDNI